MSTRKRPPPNLLDPDSDPETSTPTPKKRPPPFSKSPKPSIPPAPPPPPPPPDNNSNDDEEEDDYMSMHILEPVSRETPIQRHARLAREAALRAHPKSKAELAAEAAANREKALSVSLLETQPSSKGLSMMRAMGFTPGSSLGLGASASASGAEKLSEPIKIMLKSDRSGIGHSAPARPKVTEIEQVVGETPEEYRARVAESQDNRRREAQVIAAQKIAEGLSTDGEEKGTITLKGTNVLWRGLLLQRARKEAETRMRYELSQGLTAAHDLDPEDKTALGLTAPPLRKLNTTTTIIDAEELEEAEEDEELAAFEALDVKTRLEKLCEYLRSEYNYCFWCKYRYDDADMEGCPGVEEDLHG